MAEESVTQFADLLNLQLEQPNLKRRKEYGLKVVKSLWSSVNGAADAYYPARNKQFTENEKFAKGEMDIAEFKKRFNIEGNSAYMNLDWKHLLKIVPRYMQALLGGFMSRDEKVSINATDILSKDFKEFEKTLAKFRLANKEKIQAMQQETGVKLDNGYMAEDLDELELYYDIEYKLPEEMYFEKTIQEVIQNSDEEDLKRTLLSDIIKKGFAATKIENINDPARTPGNRLRIKRCKPDRVIYNVFENPHGKDVTIIGEAYPVTVSDIRRNYPKIPEQQLFEIARKATQGLLLSNPLKWEDRYISQFSRPYDEYKVNIFDCEMKVLDKDYYVSTTNQYDKEILVKKKGKPDQPQGQIIEDVKYNMYCGVWVIDTDIILQWDVAPNQIRAYQNGFDCFSSYSIVMPDADGTYIPSLLERGITVVKSLVFTYLKIQQMKLQMKPNDLAIDIAGLRDLELGTGNSLQPLEIMRIYDQTGRIYYDSTDVSGTVEDGKRIPFQEIPNSGNAAQINTLIGLYNFELQRLNDEWGTNPDALGQPVPARRSVGVNKNMIQQANQSTEYVYDFYVTLMEQNASKISMLLWDIIVIESDGYKHMDGVTDEFIEKKFDVNIEIISATEAYQDVLEMIKLALDRSTISLGEAIRVRHMAKNNAKDAELYLIKLEKKAQKDAAAAQQANVEMNAQVQQQSAQQKTQGEMMLKQAEAQGLALVNKAKLDGEGFNELIKFAKEMYSENMKTGVPIPAKIQPLIDFVLNSALKSIAIDDQKEDQQRQEEQAQQEQQQQQQAQQQEEQQEQEQPGQQPEQEQAPQEQLMQ